MFNRRINEVMKNDTEGIETVKEFLYFITKVDGVLGIIGNQGTGKTTLMRALLEENYSQEFAIPEESDTTIVKAMPDYEFNIIDNFSMRIDEADKTNCFGEFVIDTILFDELSKDRDYVDIITLAGYGSNAIVTCHGKSTNDYIMNYAKALVASGKYATVLEAMSAMVVSNFVIHTARTKTGKYVIESIDETIFSKEDKVLSSRTVMGYDFISDCYKVYDKLYEHNYEAICDSLIGSDKRRFVDWYSNVFAYVSDDCSDRNSLFVNSTPIMD